MESLHKQRRTWRQARALAGRQRKGSDRGLRPLSVHWKQYLQASQLLRFFKGSLVNVVDLILANVSEEKIQLTY